MKQHALGAGLLEDIAYDITCPEDAQAALESLEQDGSRDIRSLFDNYETVEV